MLTVTELYTRRGLALKPKGASAKRGPEFCGPCPDCGGEDRFLVWPEQNGGHGSFACRQCGKKGDVIQFLIEFEGMSFREAAKEAGMELETAARRSLPATPRKHEERRTLIAGDAAEPDRDAEIWLTQAEHFVTTRHEALWNCREARAYLAARGLDEAAVQEYRLGWQEGENGRSCVMRPRKKWGLPKGHPSRPGGRERSALWLPRGIVIPSAIDGQVSRLRIRRPDGDRTPDNMPDMKYYVVPGSEMVPLWLPMRPGIFRRTVACVVVEAELDAMLVHRAAGHFAAVLGLGTSGLRNIPGAVMRELRGLPVILVATDVGDASGAGTKGWEIWKATFPQAVRWPCLKGKDPGEMYENAPKGQGHGLIRGWVLSGLPDVYAQAAMTRIKERRAAQTAQKLEKGAERPPEAEERPQTMAVLAGPAEPMSLEGWYLGPELVRMCLHSNGLRLEYCDGDVRVRGTEQLPKNVFAKLLRFMNRHRDYIDIIAEQMRTEKEAGNEQKTA